MVLENRIFVLLMYMDGINETCINLNLNDFKEALKASCTTIYKLYLFNNF